MDKIIVTYKAFILLSITVFLPGCADWNSVPVAVDDNFGHALDEANQIMKMYKAYEKKMHKEWQEYLSEFRKRGLIAPTWRKPYIAKKYYLARKSKLKNNIELKRTPNGKYQYCWKMEINEK